MITDTIAAIATALGNSGISIIRISGEDAIDIADSIFVAQNKRKLKDSLSHTIHYGTIVEDNKVIDEVLVSVMKAPHTYTVENVVEINCHGGIVVTKRILECIYRHGARPAKPGEFTERAFLNGRIDLSQAEAVIDVINAKNKYALKSAVSQLRGNISDKISSLREILITDIAFIEAVLDDPEHLSFEGFGDKLREDMNNINNEIVTLLKASESGRLLREGINTVIVGKPNVGKSSFMNSLLGEDRAIVTDIAGTTRDTLEETINLDGISLIITDTAGIHDTEDVIEKMGIEKAKNAAETADLVIYIADASKEFDTDDKMILGLMIDKGIASNKTIILINKTDTSTPDNIRDTIEKIYHDNDQEVVPEIISISAKEHKGFDTFEEKLKKMFFGGEVMYNDEIYISNERQKSSLRDAKNSIDMVISAIDDYLSEDLLSIDLQAAYKSLGDIIGESIEDDIADKIFKDFCMGK